jgi:hypothetical protein
MSRTEPYDRLPDLNLLMECGAHWATAMGQREPDEVRARTFFHEILHKDQRLGGRDLWGCMTAGVITEEEIRNAVMDRFVTWMLHENGIREQPSRF